MRHSKKDFAEQRIIEIASARGHLINIINPLRLCLSSHTNIEDYDIIISRAEINRFEDNVTDAYLRTLDYFESIGIPVINSSKATLIAQDKFRTHLLVKRAGIPTPSTFLVHTLEEIQNLIRNNRVRYPFVIKTLYGGCGKGVFLTKNERELREALRKNFKEGESILVQERINLETNMGGGFRDMRIWVVRNPYTNKAMFVGGVYRNAQIGQFITNLSDGGNITPIESYESDVINVSERALESIGADVAGIDLARDENGNLYLLEINISFYTEPIFEETMGVNIWEHVIDLAESRIINNIIINSSF